MRALSAGWQVARTAAGAIADPGALPDGLTWVTTTVPATAASALRAAQQWSFDDPRGIQFDADDWWWRCTVDGATGPHVLHFGGIATLADVWWNGVHVHARDNMFVATEVAVDGIGTNELVIRCRALAPELAKKRPRPRWRVPMLEHQQLRWFRTTLLGRTPGWSPPCPPVGPWQAVWLAAPGEPTGRARFVARLDEERDLGIVRVISPIGGIAIVSDPAEETEGERTCELVRGADGMFAGEILVPSPRRWWPHTHGEPFRYGVAIRDVPPRSIGDREIGGIGFRTITVEHAHGDFRVVVNGVPVFCRGACWTPPDPVTLGGDPEATVRAARDAGFNMIRVGGTMTYADDWLLDALDGAGILLWQDLMFANMDYPDDDAALRASIDLEVAQHGARLAAHPCVAVICGNSEVGQQAAMAGATRDRWTPALFHEHLRDRVAAVLPEVPYIASSTDGGAFPHEVSAGATSYYGVGAYLRGFDDMRRSELVFGSEVLAFANLGDDVAPGARVHHAAWKARTPRDLGAGWDFDDVRDHYVQRLFGVDPAALRASDHERYVALGKFATGEVMARAFAEWRRARSGTRGALIWFLRDLWPGAGWGVLDAGGRAKPCLHAVARACAARAIAITDEGNNGLALHVVNDRPEPLEAAIAVALYRAGDIVVARGEAQLAVAAHGAEELALAAVFEGWYDLAYAFKFGPPQADVVHVRATDRTGAVVGDAWHFVGGVLPAVRERDVGLAAVVDPPAGIDRAALVAGTSGDPNARTITISARRFALGVTLDVPGWIVRDGGFHLAPGGTHTVTVTPIPGAAAKPVPGVPIKPLKGVVTALNAEATARF